MGTPGKIVLEVERKFCGFAVPYLTATAGSPAFHSLRPLGIRTFKDTYFDLDNRLSAAGLWVRLRAEHDKLPPWQAKRKKGGSYINSVFEELTDTHAIARSISMTTSQPSSAEDSFGLQRLAELVTHRQSWLVDDTFTIVLDKMDFGHEVGEVELEKALELSQAQSDGSDVEKWKSSITEKMDQQIVAFMQRYSWAFKSGTPVGKLTAYFERQSAR